ncbi:peptidylprolyl isomerase [Cyanobium sp. ATX 6F1]|uniref:peptidylprolyl isomerase n=1 Tax=unclassified Cyanobium TaxID=2627006 RepID=UPI0020CF3924|nr:peptidylprolyl isomerase [Cyanobium sp. ATX 6F1]MCP9917489.1 peptidylprolyl isomerase [Cyanobium sp. ATX 6F1]
MSEQNLPPAVQSLSDNLPLPNADLIRSLAAAELLEAYLQRQMLEALCDQLGGPDSDRADDPSEALLAYGKRQGLASLEELDDWRQSRGLGLDQLERLVGFEARLQRASETLWASEVASLFLQHRADFDQVVMSVVRIDDADLATELFFQMQEGELSFPELVENYAQGLDRTNRGIIGPIRVQQLNPLLAKVVRRYKPGVLIPPLDVNGRVHLMRVESLQPAQLDGPLQDQLLIRLRSQWLSQQLLRLRQRLLEAAWASPEVITAEVVA